MVHNGVLQDFQKLKRELILKISPRLFPLISGTTDSELMFYLALTFGLEEAPKKAIANMVKYIEEVATRYEIEFPVQMTLGISNGESIFGFRYSTIGKSRSLFHSVAIDSIKDIAPNVNRFSNDARALVSEPLGRIREAWVEVPESSYVMIEKGKILLEEFNF